MRRPRPAPQARRGRYRGSTVVEAIVAAVLHGVLIGTGRDPDAQALEFMGRATEGKLVRELFWWCSEREGEPADHSQLRTLALRDFADALTTSGRRTVEDTWFTQDAEYCLQWYLIEKFVPLDEAGIRVKRAIRTRRPRRAPASFLRPVVVIGRVDGVWRVLRSHAENVNAADEVGVRIQIAD